MRTRRAETLIFAIVLVDAIHVFTRFAGVAFFRRFGRLGFGVVRHTPQYCTLRATVQARRGPPQAAPGAAHTRVTP